MSYKKLALSLLLTILGTGMSFAYSKPPEPTAQDLSSTAACTSYANQASAYFEAMNKQLAYSIYSNWFRYFAQQRSDGWTEEERCDDNGRGKTCTMTYLVGPGCAVVKEAAGSPAINDSQAGLLVWLKKAYQLAMAGEIREFGKLPQSFGLTGRSVKDPLAKPDNVCDYDNQFKNCTLYVKPPKR